MAFGRALGTLDLAQIHRASLMGKFLAVWKHTHDDRDVDAHLSFHRPVVDLSFSGSRCMASKKSAFCLALAGRLRPFVVELGTEHVVLPFDRCDSSRDPSGVWTKHMANSFPSPFIIRFFCQ